MATSIAGGIGRHDLSSATLRTWGGELFARARPTEMGDRPYFRRHYGDVRVVDSFLSATDSAHQLPPMYDELPARGGRSAAPPLGDRLAEVAATTRC